ncbi:restriction endonuclease [Chitinophaga sp. RAB17]|uniref:restriction endonuclease n=1 Tax=Chitinophaga sp. RAB17 TaxID=3233049 RepID=UPI003F8F227D
MLIEDIQFDKISPAKFEELCFELLFRMNYRNIRWREGGADSGRDLEAEKEIELFGIQHFKEKWFFECKHYQNGVPPAELNSKIAWADAERPDHLVFFVSSYLTNASRSWIEKIHPKPYKIHVIEGKELKKILINFQDLIYRFFNTDLILQIIKEAQKNWLLHRIFPDCEALVTIFEKIDFDKLSTTDIAFLTTSFHVRYDWLKEQLDKYYGVKVEKCIIPLDVQLAHINTDKNASIINIEDKIDVLADNGDVIDYDIETNYGFIAAELAFHRHKYLGLYALLRIDDNSAIEMLSICTSSFEARIKLVDDYSPAYFKNALKALGYREENISRISQTSPLMTSPHFPPHK